MSFKTFITLLVLAFYTPAAIGQFKHLDSVQVRCVHTGFNSNFIVYSGDQIGSAPSRYIWDYVVRKPFDLGRIQKWMNESVVESEPAEPYVRYRIIAFQSGKADTALFDRYGLVNSSTHNYHRLSNDDLNNFVYKHYLETWEDARDKITANEFCRQIDSLNLLMEQKVNFKENELLYLLKLISTCENLSVSTTARICPSVSMFFNQVNAFYSDIIYENLGFCVGKGLMWFSERLNTSYPPLNTDFDRFIVTGIEDR